MSIRTTSPIAHERRGKAFLPALKIAVPAVDPPSAVLFTNEQTRPACEDCSRLQLLSESLANLRQSTKKKERELERIIQEKIELLGIAAHDLRLPLATIRTCSALLAETVEDQDTAGLNKLIDSIHSTTEFMFRLLGDTLDLAVAESGTMQLHAAPEILAAVVARCVSMSFPLAADKQMSITLVQDGEPQPVFLDTVKMSKVFNNLLENAIKYCQPGARIEVRISRGTDTVLVAVRDDGPGIDAADLKTLFTPFQRTRARALSEEPSAGLGLAIAKHIVDLHEGQIWVKSEVGKGTTFYVSLPTQARPMEAPSIAKKS